jgi:hypothetical protein
LVDSCLVTLQVSTKGRFCSRAEPPWILSKHEFQNKFDFMAADLYTFEILREGIRDYAKQIYSAKKPPVLREASISYR